MHISSQYGNIHKKIVDILAAREFVRDFMDKHSR